MVEWLNGRYEPLETLGAGAEGRVVKALDHQHDRVVALKIRPVRSAVARDELLAEARILLGIPPHLALPLVREDFFDGDNYVIAMDWVDGTNLAALLADGGRPGLAPSSVLAYLAEAAEALTHLHTQDPPVIHGDVKPGNLILTRGGRVKLVDFGMSSAPDSQRRRIGTPGFRAPELAVDGRASRASDVYSLAATAFALLTGSAPAGVLPSWEGVDPTQAAQLEEAIRLGLATDPARRPATAGEFVERLRAGWAAALPTGVMTFCLSDIEGSTSLWEQQPNAMAQALVRHDEIISDAVESNGGRFLKSMGEGDSTVSVFDSARQATEAVIVANRALAAEPWPGDLAVRVRFGIHTGEAERRGTDYFGPTLNLAARLRAQADGGQAFVSSVTAALITPSLPQGFTLVDLGPHRMRGLQAPERILALHGPGVDAPRAGTECPYRGLLAFQAADRDLFFGRDDVIEVALRRLRRGGLLAVVGASGSGKSSLLRAGLAGAADAGEIPGIARAHVITPGADPLLDLSGAADVLVVVDQFEELFTSCDDPARRAAFIESLLAVTGPVVIGVRADFYGELSLHTAMAEAVSANQILLGPMTETQLRDAITEPARIASLKLEPGFVDVVLRDVAGEPGALPLLSHALRATWERRDGRTLTVEGYHETGGVTSALARTADDVVEGLSDEERATLRQVLLRMTGLSEGTEDTRRRVDIDELVPEGASAAAVHGLLEKLADARLVTLDAETAEVAHEVLIRAWPTLRTWLDEDREGLRLHRRLSDASRLWDAGGHEEADLYRGTRLDATNEYAQHNPGTLNTTERAFLDASVDRTEREHSAQARSNRRLRRLLVSTSMLLVLALATGGFALIQRRNANDRAREATVQRIAAQSAAIGEDDVPTSALLAVEAFRRDETPATRSALIGALQQAPAQLRYFTDTAPSASSASLSDDGRLLAVSHGGRVEFYDTTTFEPAYAPIEVEGGIESPIFVDFSLSGDGRWAAVTGPAATIELWDIVEHKRVGAAEVPVPDAGISDLEISPDGSLIVVTLDAPSVYVLDAKMHAVAGPVSLGSTGAPNAAFCGDAATLVTTAVAESGTEIEIVRRRADTLEPLGAPATIPGVDLNYLHCARGPKLAVLAAFGGPAAAFDMTTGKRVGRPIDVVSPRAAGVTPDGRTLLVLELNGALHRYDINTGDETGAPIVTGLFRSDLVVAPDGRRAFVSGTRIVEIALDGTTPLGPVLPGTAGATRVSVGTNDEQVAITTGAPDDPVTNFIDVATGTVQATVPGYAHYLADGRSIVAIGSDSTVSVGTPDNPKKRWSAQLAAGAPLHGAPSFQNYSLSDDGTVIAITNARGELSTFDLLTGAKLAGPVGCDPTMAASRNGCLPAISFAVSPNGELLAVTFGLKRQIDFFDAKTGKPAGASIEAAFTGGAYVFTPDGAELVIGGRDGSIGIADVRERAIERVLLSGHTARVASLAILADRTTLVSTSLDRTVRFWDLDARIALGRPIDAAPPAVGFDLGFAYGLIAPTPHGVLILTSAGILAVNLDPTTLVERVCARPGTNLSDIAFAQYFPGESYRRTCPQYGTPPPFQASK